MSNDSSLLEDRFLHSEHIFCLFCCWWISWTFGNFCRGHTNF